MRRYARLSIWLLVLGLILPAGPMRAQEATAPDVAMMTRLFEADSIPDDWFAPSFLAQVPAAQVQSIVGSLRRDHGELRGIDLAHGEMTVHLQSADLPATIELDREGRIAGLFFRTPILGGDVDQFVDTIAGLGNVSLLVLSDGTERAAIRPDVPFAVGSAAKLAVLAAAKSAVEAGTLTWETVVSLRRDWRSLPSGILQTWPAGTPMTLGSLAALAISISDNTATDALIHTVGRSAVEAYSPRNTPFLTTRELFALKARSNADLLRVWNESGPQQQRALLDTVRARPLPDLADLDPALSTRIEWFLTARELCELLDGVSDLPAFEINPGPARKSDWTQIAFKGGSETGVLNLSTRLVDGNGQTHCVVATWNDDGALDEGALLGPYTSLIAALRTGE